MRDPLEHQFCLELFDEVRELVRTVEISVEEISYRIEIYKNHTNPETPFAVDFFLKRRLPTPNGKLKTDTLDSYFLDTSLPRVEERTPECALATALLFLSDRHPKTTLRKAA
jgi:hypothetical protein